MNHYYTVMNDSHFLFSQLIVYNVELKIAREEQK